MSQLPYSPYLAPSEYYLFRSLEHFLPSKTFHFFLPDTKLLYEQPNMCVSVYCFQYLHICMFFKNYA